MDSSGGTATALRRLYRSFPAHYRRRLLVVLLVMVCGAVAEVMSLGAVLPFLALMADPARAADYPLLVDFFALFGWEEPENILPPVAVLFVVLAIVAAAIRIILTRITTSFVSSLGHVLATEVYRRILYQPYSYHVNKNSSESVAAVQVVHSMTQGLLFPAMQAIIAAAIGICLIALLAVVDPVMVPAAFAVFGTIYFFVGRATRRMLNRGSETLASTYKERVKAVQEGIGGIRDIVIDDAQLVFVDRFEKPDAAYSNARATAAFVGEYPRYAIEAVGMSLIAVLALYLSTRSGGLDAALPLLGALALGAQKLFPLMQRIYGAQTAIRSNYHLLLDVLELLELPVDTKQASDNKEPLAFDSTLRFENVAFRYGEEGPLVLDAIDFEIDKGTRLGIIGTTGSGKSTLMDLLMGLLRPSEGAVCVDGVDIDENKLSSWRSLIAHVPQAIFLSDAALSDNIAFGVAESEVDMQRVTEAAKKAKLHDFVETLAKGYETEVGERGIRLSGGQRQRVGIARALYKGASVLVFDEATSALDSATESAVMEAILSLDSDLTLVIVAHRLATVSGCDQILRIEGGEIVASGSYEEVVLDKPASDAPT